MKILNFYGCFIALKINKKLLHIMKISMLLMISCSITLFAGNTYSQNASISLDLKNANIRDVFKAIEKQSDYRFFYNENQFDLGKKLDVQTSNIQLADVLNNIFQNSDIAYRVVDKYIVIVSMKAYQSELEEKMAQQKKVTGMVTEASTGEPLPGVNVLVEGTTMGVITADDGKYSIDIPANATALVFSYIGYVTEKVALVGQTTIDIKLVQDIQNLEEIVVVGYGTQKRANVVGAVASVDGNKLQSIPAVNVSNAISGLIPGATIVQQTGEPGQMTPRIMIRGRSTLNSDNLDSRMSNDSRYVPQPLIVIDGVPGRSMDEIDPVDVESLSVLKDASAAIYGAQAANGVILIKTKSGKEGKPRLNYQFYQGFMTPTLLPEVTDAAEYATMLSEYQVAQGKARRYNDADIELFRNGKDPWEHPNTDWYGDLIKKWTTTSRHNLALDGGSKGMRYYFSLGYKTDDAFYKASSTKYKQYNVRAKLDFPINKWLKTGVELAGFFNNRIYPYKSADAIVGQSTRLVPTNWSFWPTGEPGPDIEYGDNPVETSTLSAGKNDQKTYKLLSTFSATIDVPFIKGLSFTGSYNYDLTNYYNKAFYQPWTLYYPNWDKAVRGADGFITSMPLTPTLRGLSSPENNERYERTYNQTIMVNANYVKSLGNHNIALFAGFEQYSNDFNSMYAYRKYYISPIIQTLDAGNPKDQNITGTQTIYARKSYIGRATYDYAGKYLAEFVFRADGSLKFPKSKRWGYFPGFLVGWRASEEDFWKNNLSFFNYFKLRASFGMMGMDPGNPFQFMDSYGVSSGMVFGTGGFIETAVGPPTIANVNITWETQKTYNVGFDSKFMNDLFHLNAEFFYNKREDILVTRDASVPNYSGLSLPKENIGIVDNRGFELDGGFHKSINSDLRIDVTANFSYNHNEIVEMDEPKKAQPWQQLTGHSFGAWLMYDAIGIFRDQKHVDDTKAKVPGAKPGDVIFRDVNDDGVIDGNDRILFDRVDAPETFYGGTVTVNWKAFTISAQIQGQGEFLKRSQYDNRRGEAGNYYKWQYDGRWTPTNTNAKVARAYNRDDLYWSPDVRMSDYWLENTAYCRLKNVMVNYSIPTRFYSKIGIAKASIYFTGNNLGLIYSATKKWDPETNNPGVYPTMKTFAVGANLTF